MADPLSEPLSVEEERELRNFTGVMPSGWPLLSEERARARDLIPRLLATLDAARGDGLRDAAEEAETVLTWIVWDMDTMNVVGSYATRGEARRRRDGLRDTNPAARPGTFVVYQVPPATRSPAIPEAGLDRAWKEAEAAATARGYRLTNMADIGGHGRTDWMVCANDIPADVLTVISGRGQTFLAALQALTERLRAEPAEKGAGNG